MPRKPCESWAFLVHRHSLKRIRARTCQQPNRMIRVGTPQGCQTAIRKSRDQDRSIHRRRHHVRNVCGSAGRLHRPAPGGCHQPPVQDAVGERCRGPPAGLLNEQMRLMEAQRKVLEAQARAINGTHPQMPQWMQDIGRDQAAIYCSGGKTGGAQRYADCKAWFPTVTPLR